MKVVHINKKIFSDYIYDRILKKSLNNIIADYEQRIKDLTERMEDAENNEMTYTPTPATSHYLQDSADSRFRKFIPIGRTTQESTTGANLQKFNTRETATYNYKCDEKGQVTITGNISSYVSLGYNLSSNPMTLTAGTYKLKVIGKISSNTSILLNGTTGITLDSNQEYTYILSNDTSSFYIALSVNTGTHDDNFYITLASGTTATTERYTGGEPAPNPNYPYAIKNTGDNVNEFDVETWVNSGNNSNYYSYVNGELSINALDTRTFSNFTEDERIYLPNGDYYLSNIGSASIRIYNNDTDATVENNQFTVTKGYIYLKLVSQTVITCKPKIEKGTKATPYSPYGCGNVNEKVQNKNLFDEDNPNILNAYFSNNIITSNSSNRMLYLKCKPNTTYTITKAKTNYFVIGCTSKVPEIGDTVINKINGPSGNYDGTTVSQVYTTDSTAQYIVCRFYQISLDTAISLEDVLASIQVELGSTATSYVPHSEQNISFPLAQGQKFYEGSHPDDDEKVHHKMLERTLDGTENWEQTSTVTSGKYRWLLNVNNVKATSSTSEIPEIFSTHYKAVAFGGGNGTYNNVQGISVANYGSKIGIYDNTYNTDLTAWKTYLASQYANGTPVRVVFELAEEQTEDFTEEQKTAWKEWKKARTYKNVTHISSEDETPANVDITYVQDTKTYIDNKVTALTNAITSLGGNV